MLRRCLPICLVVLAVAATASAATAPVPDGPRLAVLKLASGSGKSEIATLGPSGGGYAGVLSVPSRGRSLGAISFPAWSPDGTQIAFSHYGRGPRMISVVAAGGGPARVVPGTKGGILPVFTPDGRELAFARVRREPLPGEPSYIEYESTAVWIVDLETGARRQLTRWRDNLEQFPSSFSPDGSTLLLTRVDQDSRSSEPEAVALRFDGRTSSLLIAEGSFPVFSPDGTKVALSRAHGSGVDILSDIYVVDADGSNLRRVTDTPNAEEYLPRWDPSGERIAYSRLTRDRRPVLAGSAAMQINADGSCLTVIKAGGRRDGFFGPTWQPGPGREAGPIAC